MIQPHHKASLRFLSRGPYRATVKESREGPHPRTLGHLRAKGWAEQNGSGEWVLTRDGRETLASLERPAVKL